MNSDLVFVSAIFLIIGVLAIWFIRGELKIRQERKARDLRIARMMDAIAGDAPDMPRECPRYKIQQEGRGTRRPGLGMVKNFEAPYGASTMSAADCASTGEKVINQLKSTSDPENKPIVVLDSVTENPKDAGPTSHAS